MNFTTINYWRRRWSRRFCSWLTKASLASCTAFERRFPLPLSSCSPSRIPVVCAYVRHSIAFEHVRTRIDDVTSSTVGTFGPLARISRKATKIAKDSVQRRILQVNSTTTPQVSTNNWYLTNNESINNWDFRSWDESSPEIFLKINNELNHLLTLILFTLNMWFLGLMHFEKLNYLMSNVDFINYELALIRNDIGIYAKVCSEFLIRCAMCVCVRMSARERACACVYVCGIFFLNVNSWFKMSLRKFVF